MPVNRCTARRIALYLIKNLREGRPSYSGKARSSVSEFQSFQMPKEIANVNIHVSV